MGTLGRTQENSPFRGTVPPARRSAEHLSPARDAMPDPDVNPAAALSERVYEPSKVIRAEHAEDSITRLIEQQAAKIPSDAFLLLAMTAMGASLVLQAAGRTSASRFVGMWAPTLLTMGVYNKLVKVLKPR
jgi:hypothetical protein